jgi:hypothetical protein
MLFRKNAVPIECEDVVECLMDAGIDFPCHDAIDSVNNCQCNFFADAFSQHATWSYRSLDGIVDRRKGPSGKGGLINQSQRFSEG